MRIFSRFSAALARLGVGVQLYLAFAVVLLLTAAVGTVGLIGLQRLDREAASLSSKWLPGVGHVASARAAMLEARDFEVRHSRTDDRSYHVEYEAKMADAAKVITQSMAAYEKLLASDDERKLFAEYQKRWGDYQTSQQRVVALGRDKKQQDAADISDGASSTAADEIVVALERLSKFSFDGGAEASRRSEATYSLAWKGMFGLVVASLACGLGLATVFVRVLLRNLGGEPRLAVEVARSVAKGDLTTRIALRRGDTQSMMAQLQAMQTALAHAVGAVRQGSENVATASAQIAEGNRDMSERTERQASALQQTAATMDELGSTVRNNADNAQQANQLALGASRVAIEGGEVVGQVVHTMKGIHDASRKIADIISVIDGIAFQTNILALNAAVEAARAGELGRGFAVVAGEVRLLAQRSAEAAKEIKALISASVQRVEQGTTLADQAGQKMGEVVKAIQRVTGIVGEISAASAEQSAGVTQVGQAVAAMDQSTQQTSALVEQSAASAESLAEQARALVEAVAVFRLSHQGQLAAA